MYQALYRKWRPLSFSDVYGQEHITTTLKNQIAENKPGHAYLFTGTRGTGKTTCAKIFARAVNCEHPVGGNPCNECDSCKGILSGNIMDVQEIDAASNNSVDDIRTLREQAVYTPAEVKKKVYIIDEVHMLSSSAWNALLKTLEEPPAHVIFILATTEIQKVPLTITSRCQRFDFRRIAFSDIKRRLSFICNSENIKIEDSALEKLAQFAEGSMRDALSMLEKLSGTDGEITADAVAAALGGLTGGAVETLADCILREDTSGALAVVQDIYTASGELDLAMSELLMYFRNLLVTKMSADSSSLIDVSDKALQKIKSRADMYPAEKLIYICHCLSEFSATLQRSRNKRIDTEIVLMRLCSPALSDSYDALLARIERLENGYSLSGGVPREDTAVAKKESKPEKAKEETAKASEDTNKATSAKTKKETDTLGKTPDEKIDKKPDPTLSSAKSTGENVDKPPSSADKKTEKSITAAELWKGVLKHLKDNGQSSIYTFVKNASASITEGKFVITTDNFVTVNMINEKGGGEIIKNAVASLTGKSMAVEAALGGGEGNNDDDPFTELHKNITGNI